MDFFFRGWWRLDGDLEPALTDLTEAINLEEHSDVQASTESSHFIRALTLLRLERFEHCDKVRDEFVIYMRGMGVCQSKNWSHVQSSDGKILAKDRLRD